MTGLTEHIRVKPPGIIGNYLRRMIVILAAVILLLIINYNILFDVFQTNILLNLAIGGAFSLGTYLCFRNIYRLRGDFKALRDIDHFLFESLDMEGLRAYQEKTFLTSELLYSLQKNLNKYESSGEAVNRILPSVARSLFNIVNNGLSERRSIMSYFSNLLLYLGLLGTFIGLFSTVSSINSLIGYLASGLSGDEDLTKMLVILIQSLEEPLDGMGVAFGTSLAGLSSSVILGALAMNVNKAGTVFGNNYSNWLFEFAISASEELRESQANSDPLAGGHSSGNGNNGAVVNVDLGSLKHALRQLVDISGNQLSRTEAIATSLADQFDAMHETLRQQNSIHIMQQLVDISGTQLTRMDAIATTQGEQLDAINENLSDQNVKHILQQLLDVAGSQLARTEAIASSQSNQLEAIQDTLRQQKVESYLMALQSQLERMSATSEKAADSLDEQSTLLGQQLSESQQEHKQCEEHRTLSISQKSDDLRLQALLQSQSAEGNQTLQSILQQVEGMPEMMGSDVKEQMKVVAEELELSLLKRITRFIKRYVRHVSWLVRKDQSRKLDKLEKRLQDNETQIKQEMEVQLEESHNRNNAITVKVFRALHHIYQLLVRKQK
ncbi:hypothetical protein [uncultured Endozoicomonas sp.]|uniref:hypothetical protein n=1 Tax=uncultured Endozoicomonas sp. TaxID=432652 RepID=UPI0026052A6A|nr:hypothetical protein [uncultured Endozoicomonas sp.]